MARTALIATLLTLCFAFSTASFVRMPLEARTQHGMRRDNHRRYYEDPLGLADTIYSTLLTIGGQNYRVIMDTGSSTVFLIGRNCTKENTGQGCQFATNFYDGSGTTFAYSANECGPNPPINYGSQSGRCGLSAIYGDGSYVYAVGIQDTATIGPYTGNAKFGLAYNTSLDFVLSGCDGIWGLGRYLPSRWVGVPGPFHAATQAGLPPQFATCLSPTGGELHLGGYDVTFSTETIAWLPWDADASHYEVPLEGITVNGQSVGYSASSASHVIFDTGSTLSYFPTDIFNNAIAQIQAHCPSCPVDIFSSPISRNLDPDLYPNMTISFKDVSNNVFEWNFSGRQYLRPTPYNPNLWGGGFFEFPSGRWLFGVTLMKNWYTIFDVGNNLLGLGVIDSAKCTGELPAAAPLNTISPSTPKPPVTSGGLTPFAGTPIEPITIPSPVDTPSGSIPPSPAPAGFETPSSSTSASISLFLLGLLALFALLF